MAGRHLHHARGAEPRKPIRWGEAWREARALVVRHRARLALGLVLLLIGRLCGFALPLAPKPLFDEVIRHQRYELIAPLALTVGGATLVQAVLAFALAQILGVAAQRTINDMRRDVQDHVVRLPLRAFDTTQTGQLISRIMTDAEGIRNLVGNGLVELVGGLVTSTVATALLFRTDWRLTSLILIAVALFGGAMWFAFKKLRPMFRERGRINAEVTGRLGESLGGIRVVKAYVAEPREAEVFGRGVDRLFANVRRTITGTSAMGASATALGGVVGGLLIWLGGREVLAGRMTPGDLFSFTLLSGYATAPVAQIAAIATQISEAFAGLDRIREVRRQATEDADDAGREPVGALRGDVAFDRVSFAYEPGRPVLDDIAFTAPAGSTTALVGPSGAGKSTLVGLVMAFNRPQSGMIEVDGRDLARLRLSEYRARLGVVLQDNFLFDGTVAENIAFARPGATRAQIEAAARSAHCDEFVAGFPAGYDTVVGERGVKLSGGQRQRVAIARALLAEPIILILDEATSSLDSESEALIQDGLRALRRGRTTFVIAHRLSTIRDADQILVLDGGRIAERGTHDELLARDGVYRRLHDRQHRVDRERYLNPGETPREDAAAR